MCDAMTSLLVNSYFPRDDREDEGYDKLRERGEQVKRCMAFVKKNENAAQAFYKHLARQTSIGTVVRFSGLLFIYMLDPESGFFDGEEDDEEEEESSCVEKKHKGAHPLLLRAKRRRAAEAKRSERVLRARDVGMINGVLKVILSGINSIYSGLGENGTASLVEHFSCENMMSAFELMSSLGPHESAMGLSVLTEIWARVIKLRQLLQEHRGGLQGLGEEQELFSPQSVVQTFVQVGSHVQKNNSLYSIPYCTLIYR